MELRVEPHPRLALSAFVTTFPHPLESMTSTPECLALMARGSSAPLSADDALRGSIRALLRHGGFKPSGRSKPASEYLVRAIEEGGLEPINLAVDACNAVSYHSGLPISVVDLDRATPPLHVAVAGEASSYVFNASGQVMDLVGLLCLFDAEGPCANAVKDSQRTKTRGETTRTLSVLWASLEAREQGQRAARWYRDLLERAGASTEPVAFV
jgi:DNA/RNA-binding domain of Phe-tRNA-synthetase-like protein